MGRVRGKGAFPGSPSPSIKKILKIEDRIIQNGEPRMFHKKAHKTMVPRKVIFDGIVKKMDVRGGEERTFIWLKERGTEREFTGNFTITSVKADLPTSFLQETIYFMEGRNKREAPLSELLGNMTDKSREFKFVRLARALRFEVVASGDQTVSLKISMPELPQSGGS
jgi:hypothetical protein